MLELQAVNFCTYSTKKKQKTKPIMYCKMCTRIYDKNIPLIGLGPNNLKLRKKKINRPNFKMF